MLFSNSQNIGGRSAVLLVEDEFLLLEMFGEILIEAGYIVRSAASAEEAADFLGIMPMPWALVTDINLGRAKMDGWELARLARQRDPERGIIYISCDSGHRWAANGVPRSLLLPKPFAAAQLVEVVSSLLNSPQQQPF
jgi:two-component system, cell cycle response regulator CpdR